MSMAAVIDLFPAEPTDDELARTLLELRRQEEAIRAKLQRRFERRGGGSVKVPGMGRVSYVRGGTGETIDAKAAEVALIDAGLVVPMRPTSRSAGLRVDLEK